MAADLRDAEGDGSETAVEGFRFIPVGVAFACFGALVGLCLEDMLAFDAHGFVDEEAKTFVEGAGIERGLSADLRDAEGDGAEAAGRVLGL